MLLFLLVLERDLTSACLYSAGVPIPGAPMLHSKALKVEGSGSVTPNKRPRSSSPIGQWPAIQTTLNGSPDADDEVEDVALGFGTLTIDVENRSRYIGLSGSAAYLNPAIWKTGKRQDTLEVRRMTTHFLTC